MIVFDILIMLKFYKGGDKMKESYVIVQANGEKFKEILNKRLNEGYEIKSSNISISKDPFNPYMFYALLVKEC